MQKKNPFIVPIILLFFIMMAGVFFVITLASSNDSLRDVKEVAERRQNGDSSSASSKEGSDERVKTVVRDSESGETQVEDVTEELKHVDENLIAAGFIESDKEKESHPASDEIIGAKIGSGSFQVSDLVFTMPVSFKTLTDNGVRVINIDDKIPTSTEDFLVYNSGSHEMMCVYDDIVFGVDVLDMDADKSEPMERKAITLMDVVSVWEDEDSIYGGRDNKAHLYFPGGVSIGDKIDDVRTIYGEYDYQVTQLVKDAAVLYSYGYEGYYNTAPMNVVSFKVKGNEDTVSKIRQGKNIK